MTMLPKFQDALIALPTAVALEAVLPGGVESLPDPVYDALRSDDVEGALRAGEAWLEEAEEGEPGPRLAYPLLLEACDRLDDALEAVERARREVEGAPLLEVVEAEIRLERGEFDRAGRLLEEFCANGDDEREISAGGWEFAGDLLLDLGDETKAVACYDRAFERGSERFETAIRLGKVRQERDEWRRAAEAFERAAELGADVVGPWDEAAECWRRAGELRRSLEARSEVLSERTDDAGVWARQGVGYRHLGELERAAEAFEKATRFAPERPEFWIERAEVLRAVGRPERAITCYREVLDWDPEYLEARTGVASAALEQGDPARAETAARRALETDERSAEARYLLSRALRAQGRLDEALEAVRRAIDRGTGEARYHRELGELSVEAGDPEAGLDHLERAVQLGAGGGEAAPVLAETLLREQQYGRLEELSGEERVRDAGWRWRLVGPVYRAVVAGVRGDPELLREAEEMFRHAVDGGGEQIPVDAELDEVERFATVLDEGYAGLVEAMIGVLEGRVDVEELETRGG